MPQASETDNARPSRRHFLLTAPAAAVAVGNMTPPPIRPEFAALVAKAEAAFAAYRATPGNADAEFDAWDGIAFELAGMPAQNAAELQAKVRALKEVIGDDLSDDDMTRPGSWWDRCAARVCNEALDLLSIGRA